MPGPHISIAAETLTTVGGVHITNSLITSWLVMAILFVLAYAATRRISIVPSNVQSVAEILIGSLYNLFESVTGKYVKQVFPLLVSIFLFVIVANWVGLLPGVGTIGFFETNTQEEHPAPVVSDTRESAHADGDQVVREPVAEGHIDTVSDTAHTDENSGTAATGEAVTEASDASPTSHESSKEEGHGAKFVPLFRGATADINTTLALALVAVLAIQYYGFVNFGKHYSSRFLNLSNPINFFLGILEIISELSKVISFAFRLFGNIFAGEVLLTVMAFLMPFVAPLPFLTLELFVGFIQALVFSMLTAVFLNVAMTHGEHEMHHAQEAHA